MSSRWTSAYDSDDDLERMGGLGQHALEPTDDEDEEEETSTADDEEEDEDVQERSIQQGSVGPPPKMSLALELRLQSDISNGPLSARDLDGLAAPLPLPRRAVVKSPPPPAGHSRWVPQPARCGAVFGGIGMLLCFNSKALRLPPVEFSRKAKAGRAGAAPAACDDETEDSPRGDVKTEAADNQAANANSYAHFVERRRQHALQREIELQTQRGRTASSGSSLELRSIARTRNDSEGHAGRGTSDGAGSPFEIEPMEPLSRLPIAHPNHALSGLSPPMTGVEVNSDGFLDEGGMLQDDLYLPPRGIEAAARLPENMGASGNDIDHFAWYFDSPQAQLLGPSHPAFIRQFSFSPRTGRLPQARAEGGAGAAAAAEAAAQQGRGGRHARLASSSSRKRSGGDPSRSSSRNSKMSVSASGRAMSPILQSPGEKDGGDFFGLSMAELEAKLDADAEADADGEDEDESPGYEREQGHGQGEQSDGGDGGGDRHRPDVRDDASTDAGVPPSDKSEGRMRLFEQLSPELQEGVVLSVDVRHLIPFSEGLVSGPPGVAYCFSHTSTSSTSSSSSSKAPASSPAATLALRAVCMANAAAACSSDQNSDGLDQRAVTEEAKKAARIWQLLAVLLRESDPAEDVGRKRVRRSYLRRHRCLDHGVGLHIGGTGVVAACIAGLERLRATQMLAAVGAVLRAAACKAGLDCGPTSTTLPSSSCSVAHGRGRILLRAGLPENSIGASVSPVATGRLRGGFPHNLDLPRRLAPLDPSVPYHRLLRRCGLHQMTYASLLDRIGAHHVAASVRDMGCPRLVIHSTKQLLGARVTQGAANSESRRPMSPTAAQGRHSPEFFLPPNPADGLAMNMPQQQQQQQQQQQTTWRREELRQKQLRRETSQWNNKRRPRSQSPAAREAGHVALSTTRWICAICRRPVRGTVVACPRCCHGGHVECMRRWYLSSRGRSAGHMSALPTADDGGMSIVAAGDNAEVDNLVFVPRRRCCPTGCGCECLSVRMAIGLASPSASLLSPRPIRARQPEEQGLVKERSERVVKLGVAQARQREHGVHADGATRAAATASADASRRKVPQDPVEFGPDPLQSNVPSSGSRSGTNSAGVGGQMPALQRESGKQVTSSQKGGDDDGFFAVSVRQMRDAPGPTVRTAPSNRDRKRMGRTIRQGGSRIRRAYNATPGSDKAKVLLSAPGAAMELASDAGTGGRASRDDVVNQGVQPGDGIDAVGRHTSMDEIRDGPVSGSAVQDGVSRQEAGRKTDDRASDERGPQQREQQLAFDTAGGEGLQPDSSELEHDDDDDEREDEDEGAQNAGGPRASSRSSLGQLGVSLAWIDADHVRLQAEEQRVHSQWISNQGTSSMDPQLQKHLAARRRLLRQDGDGDGDAALIVAEGSDGIAHGDDGVEAHSLQRAEGDRNDEPLDPVEDEAGHPLWVQTTSAGDMSGGIAGQRPRFGHVNGSALSALALQSDSATSPVDGPYSPTLQAYTQAHSAASGDQISPVVAGGVGGVLGHFMLPSVDPAAMSLLPAPAQDDPGPGPAGHASAKYGKGDDFVGVGVDLAIDAWGQQMDPDDGLADKPFLARAEQDAPVGADGLAMDAAIVPHVPHQGVLGIGEQYFDQQQTVGDSEW